MADTNPPPGWYRDPTAIADSRYWDGNSWTDTVTRTGETATVPIDPERASIPPLPGTEARPAATTTPYVTVNERRTSPALIVLLLFVAVLTIVVVVIVADGGDGSDDSPTPTQAPATEAPADNE